MSKLKDYKDKIKGWPCKKELCTKFIPEINKEIAISNLGVLKFNQAHEIFSNLEFNPAELLDVEKIEKVAMGVISDWLAEHQIGGLIASCPKVIAQAIVKAKEIR